MAYQSPKVRLARSPRAKSAAAFAAALTIAATQATAQETQPEDTYERAAVREARSFPST